jgi:hypothetical protein
MGYSLGESHPSLRDDTKSTSKTLLEFTIISTFLFLKILSPQETLSFTIANIAKKHGCLHHPTKSKIGCSVRK